MDKVQFFEVPAPAPILRLEDRDHRDIRNILDDAVRSLNERFDRATDTPTLRDAMQAQIRELNETLEAHGLPQRFGISSSGIHEFTFYVS
jgi:hypothetical protein